MRHHKELFEALRNRTGMYVQQETYVVVAAFVLGYDEAHEGGVLAGFREWLVVRLDGSANLDWPSLVLQVAFPNARVPEDELTGTPNGDRHAIETLFDLIIEFDVARAGRNGLVNILVAYERWERDVVHRDEP